MSKPTSKPATLLFSAMLASGLLGACKQPAPIPAANAPAAEPAVSELADAPELGSFGFDTAGMDRSVSPGDNFFQYANGGWVERTEIPADKSSYTSFGVLTDKALERTRAIIEESAANLSAGGDTRKIGDYYTAFMDEAAIETRGLTAMKGELDSIAAITDQPGLATAIGKTLRADVDLLNYTDYNTDRLFGLWVAQHLDKPTQYAPYLLQGGLGLPDRDFYLEDGRFLEMREKYQAHIGRILNLAGFQDADERAGRILALETAIARVHASQVQTNDIRKGANYWTRADFAKRAPGLDWDAFFTAASMPQQDEFVVWQPAAVAGISRLSVSQPLQAWKDYLAFHALDRASPLLPKAFAEQHFAFHGTTLSGTPQQQDRWKRAVNAVNGALGEAVGKVYVQRHFSPEAKARAEAMVNNILAAFDKRIDRLDWMTAPTKARAKAKLASLDVGIGHPEVWRDYTRLQVRADDALGNAARASQFEYQRNIAKLGSPVVRTEWYLLPQQVNAMNLPLENRLIFPAAILEAPFFDAHADDAVNYGALGSVIGHEITHSFDSSGALFDESGRLANWWAPEDLKRFEAAGKQLVAQYNAYRPLPDAAVNGELTLGENIADVAGVATAYDAYLLARQGKPEETLDGLSPDQRFFLGWAQAWRSKAREASLRNALLTNVHAPGQFRSETVRNQDAWYQAFEVKPGQARYLAPDQRIRVW